MSKKKKIIDDDLEDDIDDNSVSFEDFIEENVIDENLKDLDSLNEEDFEDTETILPNENIDTEFDIVFKNQINKHKLEGAHSLKRDTIFMGKIEECVPDDELDSCIIAEKEQSYDIERGSEYEKESKFHQDYQHNKDLVEDIYKILTEKTSLNLKSNRRKPNKETFNEYYKLCIKDLNIKYSRCEITVELAYYFTDNIFNMIKLLHPEYVSDIMSELENAGFMKKLKKFKFV